MKTLTKIHPVIFVLIVAALCFLYITKKDEGLSAKKVLQSIAIPYYYYDSAYDLGVEHCDAPDCKDLSPGIKQGEYDKNHESKIIISGESLEANPNENITSRRQVSIECVTASTKGATCLAIANTLNSSNEKADQSVRLNTFGPSEKIELQVISITKDELVARSKFAQDFGGDEYRIDRKNKKLTIVNFSDKTGKIVYDFDSTLVVR